MKSVSSFSSIDFDSYKITKDEIYSYFYRRLLKAGFKTEDESYERHKQAIMYSFHTFFATVPRHELTSCQERSFSE